MLVRLLDADSDDVVEPLKLAVAVEVADSEADNDGDSETVVLADPVEDHVTLADDVVLNEHVAVTEAASVAVYDGDGVNDSDEDAESVTDAVMLALNVVVGDADGHVTLVHRTNSKQLIVFRVQLNPAGQARLALCDGK